MSSKLLLFITTFLLSISALHGAETPREQWGAVPVTVSHAGDTRTIAGKKQTVTLDAKDLSTEIKTASQTWSMVASGANDMIVKSAGESFPVRLADAGKFDVVPYDAGFKSGVKLTLSQFKHNDKPLDLTLYLTLALEGKDEELAFDVAAKEGDARIDRLDWPTAMDAHDIDFTVLPRVRGILLPRDWPTPFNPIRDQNPDGSLKYPKETTEPQSNIVDRKSTRLNSSHSQ